MIFVLCLVFTSCRTASASLEIKQDTSAPLFIEEIPILAWFGVQEHTGERYRELKECGINLNFSFCDNIEILTKAMDTAKTAEIKMIIHCPELETEPEKIVSILKDHQALAGYYLYDEPHRKDFLRLGELARRIQAVDNKHFCYVNIFPVGAALLSFGTASYMKYVQLFKKEVPVQFLSFDYYPIKIKINRRVLNTRWYENLEIISDEARKTGIPFWAFALATAHKPYPIPTLADLRLQIYSNLAYGAQGIQYFTYWTPQSDIWDFHDGPIDIDGQRTPTWYLIKQMNEEIKAFSGIFLGAQVIQVRHIVSNSSGKNGYIPKGTARFKFANKPAEASIINKFDIPNNTNAVVSFLKNGKRAYMVVINRNLSGGDNVTFTIKGDEGLQLIKKDGTAIPASSENSSQTITPGDALIYGWDIK